MAHKLASIRRIIYRVKPYFLKFNKRSEIVGTPHPYALSANDRTESFATVIATERGIKENSGIESLLVVKSTEASFADSPRCRPSRIKGDSSRLISILSLQMLVQARFYSDPKADFIMPLPSENHSLSTSPFRDKIDDLISHMTLEEKAGQMDQISSFWEVTGPTPIGGSELEQYEQLKQGSVGAMLNVNGVEATRKVQQIVMDHSRLNFPGTPGSCRFTTTTIPRGGQ